MRFWPLLNRTTKRNHPKKPVIHSLTITRFFFSKYTEEPEPKEFIDYLDSLKNYEKLGVPKDAGTDSDDGLDLGRMRRLMDRLGNPQSRFKAHLYLVGPIPTTTTIDASASFSSSSISRGAHNSPTSSWTHHRECSNKSRHHKQNNKWGATVVVASSSSVNGSEQDHYAVLGVERTATSADIKKAYRLLARKYHPDVSKHSQACELFKSVRHAYEILSNEVTRTQYDRALRFQEHTGRSFRKSQYHNPEVEDWLRIYKWAEMKRKMRSGARWEHHNFSDDPSFYSDTEEEVEEGSLDEERGPFGEVLRSAFLSLFLLQTFGSLLSLTFSSLMALFDRQLDAGYKIGYFIAWILGGRGGVLLVLCLQFASWACGKTSSSMVALVVVALCVGSNLARFAPLPQGALLTLLYMSIKLQADLN